VITNFLTRGSWLWVLAAALPLAVGCTASPPGPADAQRARDTLRLALDTWKQGEAPNSLKGKRPAVYVNDHEWTAGVRLVGYEVVGDEARGANLRCRVRLSLQDKQGQLVQKDALYGVGTNPALTVIRSDELH
jgi:hypothetical protein